MAASRRRRTSSSSPDREVVPFVLDSTLPAVAVLLMLPPTPRSARIATPARIRPNANGPLFPALGHGKRYWAHRRAGSDWTDVDAPAFGVRGAGPVFGVRLLNHTRDRVWRHNPRPHSLARGAADAPAARPTRPASCRTRVVSG